MILQQVKNLNVLLKRISNDKQLLATHVSLFTALYICWQRSDLSIPFSVNRKELMAFSKIASVATYHKCIKQLDELGYIHYKPSYHPKAGSLIYWRSIDNGI
jgi:hypothetical protein